MKSWLIGKKPDAGKDWRQKENGMTENAVVGWHHWLNGFEPEQTQGDGEGKPGVLQFMGSQRVGHDLVTDQWGNTKSGVGDMVLYQRIIQPPRDFIVLIHGFSKHKWPGLKIWKLCSLGGLWYYYCLCWVTLRTSVALFLFSSSDYNKHDCEAFLGLIMYWSHYSNIFSLLG